MYFLHTNYFSANNQSSLNLLHSTIPKSPLYINFQTNTPLTTLPQSSITNSGPSQTDPFHQFNCPIPSSPTPSHPTHSTYLSYSSSAFETHSSSPFSSSPHSSSGSSSSPHFAWSSSSTGTCLSSSSLSLSSSALSNGFSFC